MPDVAAGWPLDNVGALSIEQFYLNIIFTEKLVIYQYEVYVPWATFRILQRPYLRTC